MSGERGPGGGGWRLLAGAAAIVLVVVLGGLLGFQRLFGEAAAPAPAAPVAEAPPGQAGQPRPEVPVAVLLGAEGRVEKLGAGGQWSPAAVGDRFAADDSLRTGKDGRAELAVGEKSRLTVAALTELKVRELSRAVHQLRLTRGRLVASYDADGERVLRIEDEIGSAVAETRAARFSVLANGRVLAVATETGTVNLNAAGKGVEVKAGQQAFAPAGEAPSAATPIPAEVLLKVARAAASDPELCAVIEGTVDPGSELEIEGAPVPIDPQGRFKARVARRAGQLSARVAVRDAGGRAREKVVNCSREAVAPPVDLEMKWGDEADAG